MTMTHHQQLAVKLPTAKAKTRRVRRRLTKRQLRLIAWTQWALFHAPGSNVGERNALITRLMTGLTPDECAFIDASWPIDTYEIVRKRKVRR